MKAWRMLIAFLLIAMLPLAASATTVDGEATLDTSKLDVLLEIAAGAQESDYTAKSWEALEKAIAKAEEAIASESQLRVNSACASLSTALSQLTSMNYSKLESIAAEAEQYIEENFGDWQNLFDLLNNYQELYGCGDQAAVNQKVEEFRNCLNVLAQNAQPPQPDSGVQNPGQKSPTVWIVLLIVSVLGNVALAAMMLMPRSRSRRKNEQLDDVPLVNYDIDDDDVI